MFVHAGTVGLRRGSLIAVATLGWLLIPASLAEEPAAEQQVIAAPPQAAVQAQAALQLGALAKKQRRDLWATRYYRRGIELLEALESVPTQPVLTRDKPQLLAALQEQLAASEKASAAAQAQADEVARTRATTPEATRAANKSFERAQKLAQQGKFEQAAQHLSEMLHTAPQHARADEARYLLGRYLLQAGHNAEAFRQWQRFIRLNPTGPYRAQARLDMADYELLHELSCAGGKKGGVLHFSQK